MAKFDETLITDPDRVGFQKVVLSPIMVGTPSSQPAASWDAVKTVDLATLAHNVLEEQLGPGVPISPIHPEKTEPRLFDYTPGYNITYMPRAWEDISFATLTQLARGWDVAQLCIQRNVDDIRQLSWEIRATSMGGMTRGEAKERAIRLEPIRQRVTGFWKTPDQRRSWSAWVHAWGTQLYETDSACLYLQRTRSGDLYAVRYVDGTTISPIIDENGEIPVPPQPAYRQVIRGLPWTMYMQDAELPPSERKLSYDTNHLIYEPFWGRTDSPYGHPPMEWVYLTVQRALSRQVLDYRLFADGTTSHDFWKLPETWSETQIAELQAAWDKLQQMPEQRAHLRFMPGGPNSGLEHGFLEPTTQGEEFLLFLGCAAFQRSPAEMGFTRPGSNSISASRIIRDQRRAARKGIRAVALHLKNQIDRIIQMYQSPELEIVFPELEDADDAKTRAEADDIRIRNGSLGIDEARLTYDLDPIGDGTRPTNIMFSSVPMLVADLLAGTPMARPEQYGGAQIPGTAQSTQGGQPQEPTMPVSDPQRSLPQETPSAIPGRATMEQKDITKADIRETVMDILLRQYPKELLGWVEKADWRYDAKVPLDEIDMARRPYGRDQTNVKRIEDDLDNGKTLKPLILVDVDGPKLKIADGWHRSDAAEHTGHDTVPAFIASGVGDSGPWDREMQEKRFEKAESLDLRRWQSKSLKSLKAGKTALVSFTSDVIAIDDYQRITAMLAKAQTPADVRAAFVRDVL